MNKKNIITILLIILLSASLITNVVTLKLYLDSRKINEETLTLETDDEISRVEYFIKDCVDELSLSYNSLKVYKNELQFEGGTYTLTIASNRIRAVYPRGERFFQLNHISYIEFMNENGNLQCQLFYNENGEKIINIKEK